MVDQDASRTSKTALLTGIGVGPGDPALLTLGAIDVLRRADRVVAPTTDRDMPGLSLIHIFCRSETDA